MVIDRLKRGYIWLLAFLFLNPFRYLDLVIPSAFSHTGIIRVEAETVPVVSRSVIKRAVSRSSVPGMIEITHLSGEEEQTIAPGVSQEYRITLSNTGSKTEPFELWVDPCNKYEIPLQIKIMQGNTYILGDEQTWIRLQDTIYLESMLLPEASEDLVLNWEWLYHVDEDQDQRDTAYGIAMIEDLECLMRLNIQANKTAQVVTRENEERKDRQTAHVYDVPNSNDSVEMGKWIILFFFSILIIRMGWQRGGKQR